MLPETFCAVASPKDENPEPYFSWAACECCNSKLGGERYDIIYRETLRGPIENASVCVDCYVELCS